eukprot:c6510_g1_i2.p1 GENE.c6510_g1_i2~~c6510_g1_i2.p1  ORF type:complete len:127 (+),score=19.29 c6510_g1_i2:144-524(+)
MEACPNIADNIIQMYGQPLKLGQVRMRSGCSTGFFRWHERFLFLGSDNLLYFNTINTGVYDRPSGVLHITSRCQLERVPPTKNSENCLCLTVPGHKPKTLSFATPEEVDQSCSLRRSFVVLRAINS